MASYTSLVVLSVALLCILGVPVASFRCGPGGSGLPACNTTTITAEFDALNCQGNVTYSTNGADEEAPPAGSCVDFPFGFGESETTKYRPTELRCSAAAPFVFAGSSPTPSDPNGNCTQPISVKYSLGLIGLCINDISNGASSAVLCNTDTPITVPGPVVDGPVMLEAFRSKACYAPDRCKSPFYLTHYDDGSCGRSLESRDQVEEGIELNVCYDYREGETENPSVGNFMYTFDGTFFTMAQYPSGCSSDAPITFSISMRVDTCYISPNGKSFSYSVNHASISSSTPNPSTAVVAPTSSASSSHGSLLSFLFIPAFAILFIFINPQ